MTIKEKLRIHREIEDRNHQHLIDFYHEQYERAKSAYDRNPTNKNMTKYLEASDRYYSALENTKEDNHND